MTVNYTAVVGSDYATKIQSFNCSVGRSSTTDTYSGSTATLVIFSGGLPASWVMGAQVYVNESGTVVYSGYITNIEYDYNFVTAVDTYTVSMEGFLSFFGRGVLTNFTMANKTTGATAQDIGTSLSGSGKTISNRFTRSYVDTSTYTGAAMPLLTALVAMEQGRLVEGYTGGGNLQFLARDYFRQDTSEPPATYPMILFSDAGGDTCQYERVTFSSLSDNYFTFTQANPATVATQTAGTGSRTLAINTYDISTTQASDLALYMLGEFDQNTSVPTSITVKSTQRLMNGFVSTLSQNPIGYRAEVTFRGTTYQAVIEGWTINANPNEVRYTFMLSGYEQNNYLLIDDASYGRLDYNQLSF